jgi:GT2 family glycosyltransferase
MQGSLPGMPGSVAVVIPCFNDGNTLETAVASVQEQDVPAEIIVVDDGATESSTVAAYERLQEAGVCIIHQANQGPAPARMTGVRATDADYVFSLDADDLLARGGLRRLRDVLDRHPSAAAAWGSVSTFGAIEYSDPCRPCLDPWQSSYHNHLPVGSLYRRSALVEVGGWQLAGGYEDWDLWMTLAERGWKGIGIPEVTAHYRMQSGRRLSRSSRRHAERYTACPPSGPLRRAATELAVLARTAAPEALPPGNRRSSARPEAQASTRRRNHAHRLREQLADAGCPLPRQSCCAGA